MNVRLIFAALGLGLCACQPTPSTHNRPAPSPMKVGGDQDEHGCKASAGYSWSEVTQACVRIWEVGTRLYALTGDMNGTGFLIFGQAQSRAEVHLPHRAIALILEPAGIGWEDSASGLKLLKTPSGEYVLYDRSGTALFGTQK